MKKNHVPLFQYHSNRNSLHMKKIAVLLATYNGEKFIKKQIQTILNQESVHVQIFVNDDISTDSTIKVIESIKESHQNITILEKSKKYGSAAANFFMLIESVDLSDFDYVALSDQDDIWMSDKLIFSISQLSKNNCQAFSSSVMAYWPESGEKKLIRKSFHQTDVDHWFESPGPGCSQVFTTDSFISLQNFIREHKSSIQSIDYHDWFIYAYYRFNKLNWHISDHPKMLYVQHSSNQIGANSGVSSIIRRIRMIKSKWYRHQINTTYSIITGSDHELLNYKFILANIMKLRRKKIHSLSVFFMFFTGLM